MGNRLTAGLLVLWGALGLTVLFVYRNFTVDDAFIGWRHGLNLAEYGVYAYNSSGARVEAATSPLFGILAAIPAIFGVDVVLFFKCFALATGAVFVALVWNRVLGRNRWLVLLVALAGPLQAIHLWSGLETGVYVLLSALLALYALECMQLSPTTVAGLSVVAVLTRQEAAFMICGVVWLRFLSPSLGGGVRAAGAAFAKAGIIWAPPLGTVVGLSVWRWAYFGSPLPNTFATKTGEASRDLGVILDNAISNLGTFLPIGIAVLTIAFSMERESRRRYLLLLAWASLSLLLYLPSTLSMGYAHRFPYQALWPVLIAGAALTSGHQLMRVTLAAVCALAPAASLGVRGSMGVLGIVDYYPRMSSAMQPLGEALRGMEHRGVLVMGDAGQTPFVSTWYVLDTNFLGTPSSVGEAGIVNHVRKGERTVLALYAEGPNEEDLARSEYVYRQAAVEAGFQRICSVQWRKNYWFEQWASPDLSASDRNLLLQACGTSVRDNTSPRLRDSLVSWYWHT